MDNTLTWLHLCTPKTGWKADKVIEKLKEDLSLMQQQHHLKPDLLFFTGDLAFGQLGEDDYSIQSQFEEVSLLLDEICQLFKLSTEQVFIVAGNHDINRNSIGKMSPAYLASLSGDHDKDTEEINGMLHSANQDWQQFMQRLTEYQAFLQENYPHLLQDPKRLTYAIEKNINGVDVGIAGFNSAWSCATDKEKGKLWLGGKWQIETLSSQLKQSHLKIALSHHPLNWLVEQENPAIDPLLEQQFDFFLHGHEHQSWVDINPEHIRLAAGACYGEKPSETGYSFVRLNLEQATGEVWLRKFDDQGLGWIPRVIPQKTNNDGLWSLDNLNWLVIKPKIETQKSPVEAELQTENLTVASSTVETNAAIEQPHISANSPESRGIFGRTEEIEKLAKRLQDKPILSVYGISGIGKTKLVNEIARHIAFHEFEPMLSLAMTPYMTIDELYRHLATSLGCRDENPALKRTILKNIDFEVLDDFSKTTEPRILHLYKAHELFNQGDQGGFYDVEIKNLLIAIALHLPQLRVILESAEFPPENLLPNGIHQVKKLKGLDASSVQAYFRRPSKHSTGWQLSDDEAQELYLRLGGKTKSVAAHPLGMNLLASVAEGLNIAPLAVVERHNGLFYKKLEKELFNDLYEQVLNDAERCVLALCALYRDVIPHIHIEMLNQHAGEEQAFDHLVRRFLLSPDEREERYSLHSLFAELLQQRSGKQGLRDKHALIGEAWLSQVKGKKRNSLPNILASCEAAYHLLQAQAFQRLQELSSNLLGRDTIPILERCSRHLHDIGDNESNRHVLELLVALDSENHKAHRFLGEAIEQLEGRGNKQALEHYLTAYRLLPDFPAYLANIGRCLLMRNEAKFFVELVDNLDERQREKSVDERVQSLYAKCLDRLGNKDQASLLRQTEIKEGSRNPAFYAEEAKNLAEQREFTEALKVFKQAESAGCMNDYLYAIKADVLQQSGETQQASTLRQQQIQAGTTNPAFYNDEAIYCRNFGHYRIALKLLDLADDLELTNEHIRNTRKSIQNQQKQFVKK